MNARSIGIEHKNATGAPTWTISEATYASSAKLIADIAHRYGFYPDSTHVIPHKQVHATACPGGIDMNKLIRMAQTVYNGGKVSGGGSSRPSAPSKPASTPTNTPAIQQFKNAGNKFTAYKSFRVDEIKKINGIWQAINYNLAGGKNFNWVLNGIPLDIVDNVTRGNSAPTKVGDQIKFMNGYNSGTIDQYDNASNGVGIVEGKYGMVWYNADALLKL